jgi:adenylate cyclase
MAVGGLPVPSPFHAESVANMSLEVLEALKDFNEKNIKALGGKPWNIRIGLHTGSVVAGVIGKKKYLYDLYGESVTTATLMESSGSPGKIHVSEATYEQLKNKFNFIEEKTIHVKESSVWITIYVDLIIVTAD